MEGITFTVKNNFVVDISTGLKMDTFGTEDGEIMVA